ncbi:MAG: hypothetical protein ACK55I_50305, partial [bacterium]
RDGVACSKRRRHRQLAVELCAPAHHGASRGCGGASGKGSGSRERQDAWHAGFSVRRRAGDAHDR